MISTIEVPRHCIPRRRIPASPRFEESIQRGAPEQQPPAGPTTVRTQFAPGNAATEPALAETRVAARLGAREERVGGPLEEVVRR